MWGENRSWREESLMLMRQSKSHGGKRGRSGHFLLGTQGWSFTAAALGDAGLQGQGVVPDTATPTPSKASLPFPPSVCQAVLAVLPPWLLKLGRSDSAPKLPMRRLKLNGEVTFTLAKNPQQVGRR